MDNLVFEGNKATAAGFDDSNAAAGPAVSNVGTLSTMKNVEFVGNTFFCSEGTYVDYIQVTQTNPGCWMVALETRLGDQANEVTAINFVFTTLSQLFLIRAFVLSNRI